MCTGVMPDGTIMIAEAQPGGAVHVPFHYGGRPHLWSTGILPTCPDAGPAAYQFTLAGPWGDHGVPYSYLDYLAIGAYSWHLPGAVLIEDYVATTMHMICSQLVDQARLDGDSHLFSDGRKPGNVMPSTLGWLLGA